MALGSGGTADDTVHDPTVMESAMDTGSDDGEPGERPDEGPLNRDERALLDRLTDDGRAVVVTDALEDSPAAARAVADETVLPEARPGGSGPADAGPDPETPEFRGP